MILLGDNGGYEHPEEDILPSEKAHAYKMKYEAMKHQGSKGREAYGGSGRRSCWRKRKDGSAVYPSIIPYFQIIRLCR